LAEALGSSIPVVALVSDLPVKLGIHAYRSAASQALDQAALLAPVTKWHATVPSLSTMPALVRQAFREATTGRPGPVALFLPQDVLDAQLPSELVALLRPDQNQPPGSAPQRFGTVPPFRVTPSQPDVEAVARVLRASERPLILAGGGVLSSGAEHVLQVCAELLGAAVATTLTGKGAIAETHPLAVGVHGVMGAESATAAMHDADVVLLVGAKSSGGATFSWTSPRADQTVVQIDIDPLELGRAFPLAAAMLADARDGLAALAERLRTTGPASPSRQPWRESVAQHKQSWSTYRDAERASISEPIAPQRVLGELEQAMAPADVLVCDASLSSGWGGAYFEQPQSGRRVLTPRGQAGLGFALPAAIGAATADAGRRTVVLTGDGALGYAVGELATVIENRLPITVIVLNNSSLGWIRWYRRITFGTEWAQPDFADTDFRLVAQAYGWSAERVTSPNDLGAALRRALDSTLPSLVDVVTETWETPVASHRRALQQGNTTEYGG
jgi:acetolactate synthase I/II/III large subunit